jgi:drug/metabolite transporter (DMT)-like permease
MVTEMGSVSGTTEELERHRRRKLGVGPYWVALGTALWGTESAFRIPLTEKGRFGKDGLYHSDVLVLIEHVFILGSFIPWIIANRATWPSRISLRAWIYVVISGICGSAIGTIFFTEALRVGNPTVVNLLLNIQPIISTLGGFVLFRERPGAHFLIWAPAALTAGLFLTTNPLEAGNTNDPRQSRGVSEREPPKAALFEAGLDRRC